MPKSKESPFKAVTAWWKPIAFVLGAVILTASGVTAWGTLRPYVTTEEGVAFAVQVRELHEAQEVQLQVLTGISCETQISIIKAEKRQVQRDLIAAEGAGNATAVRILKRQLEDVGDKLSKIKRRCGLG